MVLVTPRVSSIALARGWGTYKGVFQAQITPGHCVQVSGLESCSTQWREKGCHAAVMQGRSVWFSKHWKGVPTLSQLPEAFGINEQLASSKPAKGKNLLLQ